MSLLSVLELGDAMGVSGVIPAGDGHGTWLDTSQ